MFTVKVLKSGVLYKMFENIKADSALQAIDQAESLIKKSDYDLRYEFIASRII